MTEINYSELLRQLVDNYFDEQLSRVEYVAQRRALLERIDYEFNGDFHTSGWPESDITQPRFHASSSGHSAASGCNDSIVARGDRDLFD